MEQRGDFRWIRHRLCVSAVVTKWKMTICMMMYILQIVVQEWFLPARLYLTGPLFKNLKVTAAQKLAPPTASARWGVRGDADVERFCGNASGRA